MTVPELPVLLNLLLLRVLSGLVDSGDILVGDVGLWYPELLLLGNVILSLLGHLFGKGSVAQEGILLFLFLCFKCLTSIVKYFALIAKNYSIDYLSILCPFMFYFFVCILFFSSCIFGVCFVCFSFVCFDFRLLFSIIFPRVVFCCRFGPRLF